MERKNKTPKMPDPELKARWVAALRSGKYRQTMGSLRDSAGGFCCLGVLCDLVDPEGWDEDGMHCKSASLPGLEVCEKAFGWNGLPEVVIGGRRNSLDIHNDGGRTFAEIADAIEDQL